jgi:hypothetical protein
MTTKKRFVSDKEVQVMWRENFLETNQIRKLPSSEKN